MNIEDKFKQVFSEYRPEVKENSFETLGKKAKAKKLNNNFMMVAASIALFMALFSLMKNSPVQTENYASIETIQKPKPTKTVRDKIKTEIQSNTIRNVHVTPIATKTIIAPKNTKQNSVVLNRRMVSTIDYNENQKKLIGSTITQIHLTVKPQQTTNTAKKNFRLKTTLASVKKFIKKTKSKLYIPKVEIDYKSLIAQNPEL